MKGILRDVNIKGQFQQLIRILEGNEWQEIWSSLALCVESFAALGLDENALDSEVWQVCQQCQLVLITANRNRRGADSLEMTIRNLSKPDSLPVVTLGDPKRFQKDKNYAKLVVDKLLTILIEIDNYRGCGRLYVP